MWSRFWKQSPKEESVRTEESSHTKYLEGQIKLLLEENGALRNDLEQLGKLIVEPRIPEIETQDEEDIKNFEPVRRRSELPSEKRERLEKESYARMLAKKKEKKKVDADTGE